MPQVCAQTLEEFVTGIGRLANSRDVNGAQDSQTGECENPRWRHFERLGELLGADDRFGWIEVGKSELIKQEHKQLFFYLAEVNEQAHRYLGLWRVSSTNVKQLFSAALFVRALTAYQALVLLTQRGYASEARATCRNILEAKF